MLGSALDGCSGKRLLGGHHHQYMQWVSVGCWAPVGKEERGATVQELCSGLKVVVSTKQIHAAAALPPLPALLRVLLTLLCSCSGSQMPGFHTIYVFWGRRSQGRGGWGPTARIHEQGSNSTPMLLLVISFAMSGFFPMGDARDGSGERFLRQLAAATGGTFQVRAFSRVKGLG